MADLMLSCRDCEAITQPPAPFYATPRGYRTAASRLQKLATTKYGERKRKALNARTSSALSVSRSWPLAGNGIEVTSNKSGPYAALNTPRAPTDIAPTVSP